MTCTATHVSASSAEGKKEDGVPRNLAAAKNWARRLRSAPRRGVSKVVFDRGGYIYHGRVKALADAAREADCNFEKQLLATSSSQTVQTSG